MQTSMPLLHHAVHEIGSFKSLNLMYVPSSLPLACQNGIIGKIAF